MLSTLISHATARNWERLHHSPSADLRLTKRANKKLSTKFVFPKEYIANPLNVGTVQDVLNTIASEEIGTCNAISSLCVALLCQHSLLSNKNGVFVSQNPYIKAFAYEIIADAKPSLSNVCLPSDENDIVGLIYQCLLSEGHKNLKGSYFTPKAIIHNLTADMDAAHATILDPCCGTGVFLTGIENANPENVYGIDIDPLAVIIAKTNLFIKYKSHTFSPKIYCGDFLSLGHTLLSTMSIPECFDYIVSNPPWGASVADEYRRYYPEISSGESFSYFIAQSVDFLKPGGELRFLLPESVLNVKTHQDIRRLILGRTAIRKISRFDRCFSGVYTPVVGIQLANSNADSTTIATGDGSSHYRQSDYLQNDHCVFTTTSDTDLAIIDTIYRHQHRTLADSKWALGIVTGDNKRKIHRLQQAGMEPIYTGKDVCQYTLKPPTAYVCYDRTAFQQVAPDEMYRAEEKLVYKFISNRLVFAYDDTSGLFLNSANVLIPSVEGMTAKTVLAFLNSTMLQYLYKMKFGEIKILRGNLEKLPFPQIEKDIDDHLTKLVDAVIAGSATAHDEIQQAIYTVWGLTSRQIAYIEDVVYG